MSNSNGKDSNLPQGSPKMEPIPTNSQVFDAGFSINRLRDTQYNNQNTVIMFADTEKNHYTVKDAQNYSPDDSCLNCCNKTKAPPKGIELKVQQPEAGKTDKMLMHDTRIYYFRQDETDNGKHSNEKVVADSEIKQALTDVFLTMLTYTKYRILLSFYIFFRLTDNLMLLALVVSLFLDNGDTNFGQTISANGYVFVVLGGELFYDVMEHTVQVWMLNRISIYIGFMLYGLYAFAFWFDNLWSELVIILYFIRLSSYILELATDYCIDLEIQHDFIAGKVTVLGTCWINCVRSCIGCCCEFHQDEHTHLNFPHGWKYVGSRFAWTLSNVFLPKIYYRDYFTCECKAFCKFITKLLNSCCCFKSDPCLPHRACFDLMLFITLIFMSPFVLVAVIILGLLAIGKCCVCCRCYQDERPCRNTVCGECRYQRSF